MDFKVSFPGTIRNRLLRLKAKVEFIGLGAELGHALAAIHQCLTEQPLELGEIQYTLKHHPLPVCLLVRGFLSVSYVVDVPGKKVMVAKMRMLQDHPFPIGFEKIVNDQ
jgi:hypothetical protein